MIIEWNKPIKSDLIDTCKASTKVLFFVSLIFIHGCAGYYEYAPVASNSYYKYEDNTGLFQEITGKQISEKENFRNNFVSKQDVIDKWGLPYDISVRGSYLSEYEFEGVEYWRYERDISFEGVAPFVMNIPFFLVMWPSGYYTTTVTFKDQRVSSVDQMSGEFKQAWSCIFPLGCRRSWRIH